MNHNNKYLEVVLQCKLNYVIRCEYSLITNLLLSRSPRGSLLKSITNYIKRSRNNHVVIMAIRVDISYIPEDLKNIILNSMDVQSTLDHETNNNKDVIIFTMENNVQKIKQIVQGILSQNHVNAYIVAENSEKENEITILKQGDMEQFGIYICTHCAMSFESEIQRTIHQRIHYFT